MHRAFDAPPGGLQGVSLAVGAAAARACGELGAPDVGLKWPNDLVWHGRKLGGVLVEVLGDPGGRCRLVAGVGLNLGMPSGDARAIDQPWADLREAAGGSSGRNQAAGRGEQVS